MNRFFSRSNSLALTERRNCVTYEYIHAGEVGEQCVQLDRFCMSSMNWDAA